MIQRQSLARRIIDRKPTWATPEDSSSTSAKEPQPVITDFDELYRSFGTMSHHSQVIFLFEGTIAGCQTGHLSIRSYRPMTRAAQHHMIRVPRHHQSSHSGHDSRRTQKLYTVPGTPELQFSVEAIMYYRGLGKYGLLQKTYICSGACY